MNQEILTKAGIAYAEGVARFSGKTELYEKFLKKFFDKNSIATLMEQLESSDVEGAFRTAHDLKGNTGNLSLNELYSAIYQLVELLRSGNTSKEEYMPSAKLVLEKYELAKQAVLEAQK